MSEEKKYEEVLDQARSMFASGHDERYIELQLAEKGIDDSIIDAVVKDIKKIRKAGKKKGGLKLVIYGTTVIIISIAVAAISFDSESPVRFILWGLVAVGVGTLFKGLGNIIGL